MRLRSFRPDFELAWCDPPGALGRDEAGGNVLDPSSFLGDIQNEPKGVVIAEIDRLTVEVEENCRCQPTQPLVAINQCMVGHDRMQESSRFEPDSRVGVLPERTRLGSGNGRIQETEVSHRANAETTHQTKKVFKSEILDSGHIEPSRSRTSPHRSTIRSVLSATFLAWPARS